LNAGGVNKWQLRLGLNPGIDREKGKNTESVGEQLVYGIVNAFSVVHQVVS